MKISFRFKDSDARYKFTGLYYVQICKGTLYFGRSYKRHGKVFTKEQQYSMDELSYIDIK